MSPEQVVKFLAQKNITDLDKTLICDTCGNMVYNYNDVKPGSYLYALLKDNKPDESIENMTQEWFQKIENKDFVSIRKNLVEKVN